MPKLWNETIQAHRRDVREAILDTTAALVAEHGLLSVTMSRIAEATGIGRATLYKYFPDVETILLAWHERHVTLRLEHLSRVRAQAGSPSERLAAVLTEYAFLSHRMHARHDDGLAVVLHQGQQGEHRGGPHGEPGGEHLAVPHQQLRDMVRDLLADAATEGSVRTDVAPEELAGYCLDALAGARRLPTEAAVQRLVTVTLDGLSHRR